MKRMFTVLAATLIVASASAQKEKNNPYYSETWSDNIFITVGGGGQVGLKTENYNAGFWRAVTPEVHLAIGKHINPLWSMRLYGSGWRAMDKAPRETRNYVAANVDAIFNLSNAFAGYNPDRVFEFSAFAGPGATFSRKINKTKPQISAGLQARFNFNEFVSFDIEARGSRQEEIVRGGSDRFYVSATGGLTFTLGGKKFANCNDKLELCLAEQMQLNQQINADRAQIADLESQLAAAKRAAAERPAPVAPTVTKDCDPNAGPVAVFFQIGKANLDDRGKANIQLAAKAIKADPNGKYSVTGYADQATGSAGLNQKLSERRAKVVYDALVAAGVSASQLEQTGMGGQPNMFNSNALNRVVIVKRK